MGLGLEPLLLRLLPAGPRRLVRRLRAEGRAQPRRSVRHEHVPKHLLHRLLPPARPQRLGLLRQTFPIHIDLLNNSTRVTGTNFPYLFVGFVTAINKYLLVDRKSVV